MRHAKHPAQRPTAKLKVEVLTLCKRSGKDGKYDDEIASYEKRMSPVMAVSSRWVKPERSENAVRELAACSSVVLLDSSGRLPKDSRHFSKLLYEGLEQGGSRISFVIGGPEGLSNEVRALASQGSSITMLSLGPLTFTHKMVG